MNKYISPEMTEQTNGISEMIGAFPNEGERPCYRVYTRPVMNNGEQQREGVYYHYTTEDKQSGELKPIDKWLCSPIEVIANTQDESKNAGRLVKVHRTDEPIEENIMLPLEDITAKSYDPPALKALSRRSVMINDNAKKDLSRFLSQSSKQLMYVRQRTGWADDTPDDMPVFLLPDETIGADNYLVNIEHHGYHQKGTLDDWKATIGEYTKGNPIVQLGIMASLAGVLLRRVDMTGGGLHFFGNSGKGKSTLLQASASVWGHSKHYGKKWKSTPNGLEPLAYLHSDTALILDEMMEVDAKLADDMIYSLSNGEPKNRAKAEKGTGVVSYDYKKPWRVMTLSSGEKSITDFFRAKGKLQKAGQSVRFLDIPATTQKYGAFTTLNGFDTPQALAEAITHSSINAYGTAGRAFIRYVIGTSEQAIMERFQYARKQVTTTPTSTEEERVIKTFAVILIAGEMAIEAGILPWSKGEPLEAVQLAFKLWRKARGVSGENLNKMHVLRAFRDKTTLHPDLFCDNSKDGDKLPPHNGEILAYFCTFKNEKGEKDTEYSFFPKTLHRITDGEVSNNESLEAFKSINALIYEAGRNTSKREIKGKRMRVYVIKASPVYDYLDEQEEREDTE